MDVTQITEILGLAGSAVGTTEKAAATIKSIKALFEGNKAPNGAEAADLLNTLAGQLTAANITNVELSEALKKLSRELHEQDEFDRDKARYEHVETDGGDFVFKLKVDMADGEPIHFICPVCLRRDKLISVIRPRSANNYLVCQTNDDHFFKDSPMPDRRRSGREGF